LAGTSCWLGGVRDSVGYQVAGKPSLVHSSCVSLVGASSTAHASF
jgi:hypothetical protein